MTQPFLEHSRRTTPAQKMVQEMKSTNRLAKIHTVRHLPLGKEKVHLLHPMNKLRKP